MKISPLSLAACLLVAGASGVVETAGAQASTRAYREGPVINVSYIRTKPGMFDKYMAYLAGPYKTNSRRRKQPESFSITRSILPRPALPTITTSC